MYITLSEYTVIKEEIKSTCSLLSNRLIEAKKIGRTPNDLTEAVIEIAGYSFAVDTWEQFAESYEANTNYMSEDQLRAMYKRSLILKGIK